MDDELRMLPRFTGEEDEDLRAFWGDFGMLAKDVWAQRGKFNGNVRRSLMTEGQRNCFRIDARNY
jgi:hypothetical protein